MFHRNITQEDLAARAHTYPSQISRIECGSYHGLTILSLKAVADALGTHIADLTNPQTGHSVDDLELQRLFTRVQMLNDEEKQLIAGTLRAVLDNMPGHQKPVTSKDQLLLFAKSQPN
ncbi:MAG: helix-turn-helix transcriptional regulator [Bacteroidetes bacterium]|nr:helix-turn-helix transcriptional regulator [Bacteroidota bacterium]MCW5896705.1 helix-turn-helix transcriptional regulator [Bacteroidota bacterium]